MSKVLSILEALIANGISAEDIKDAATQLKAGKAKKGKKPSVADMLEDLSDDELRELVVELDLMKEKAAKKAKRKDLEKALAKADPEELEDAIAELAEDDDEDDDDDDDEDEDDDDDDEDDEDEDDDEDDEDEDDDEDDDDEDDEDDEDEDDDEDDEDEDDDEDDEDEDDEDEDDDEPDYEDMSHKELVALVVKRGLAKKAKATKMDEDELIELLEEDDE